MIKEVESHEARNHSTLTKKEKKKIGTKMNMDPFVFLSERDSQMEN